LDNLNLNVKIFELCYRSLLAGKGSDLEPWVSFGDRTEQVTTYIASSADPGKVSTQSKLLVEAASHKKSFAMFDRY
jgi:hypothetical protein